MRIPEGRAAGQWQKRSRLFVASFKVGKTDELDWIDGRPEPDSRLVSAALQKRIPLLKTSEERYVLGVVLEPEKADAQQDIYSAAEVRELAPAEFEADGTRIKKGTWLLAVRVADDELWRQVKAGELTGFSIGGSAIRTRTAQVAVTPYQ